MHSFSVAWRSETLRRSAHFFSFFFWFSITEGICFISPSTAVDRTDETSE